MHTKKFLFLLLTITPNYLAPMMSKKNTSTESSGSSTVTQIDVTGTINRMLNKLGYPQEQRTIHIESQEGDVTTFQVTWPELTREFQLIGEMLYESLP